METIELNREQQAAVRRMMRAIVERDERAVAALLDREYPENVHAAPASEFWTWADDYAGKRLNLVLPPGDVNDWDVWGFPREDVPEVLALHVDVWADWGRTDLTIQFDLAPEGADYRVRLHDMHAM